VTDHANQDVSAPIFVQSGKSEFPELDQWEQVGEDEARIASDMTLRNELSGGTETVRQFEARWRKLCGCTYAVTTMNGTSALYSAYFGLNVGPGDEVICPVYTWICTISPVPFLHATPVFAESDPETMMLDPDDVRRRITPRTRAIVAVHLWGWVCDMDPLMAISRETGVPVIEDCSHAHGAMYKGRPVGSIGHAAAWSLQGSKPVSAGEGGIVATNDPEVFDRIAMIGQVNRIAGLDLQTPMYQRHQPLGTGMKFRAHPLGIGIAQVQLAKLADLNRRRSAYVEEVEAGLADIPGLRPVPTYDGVRRAGFYGFPAHYNPDELNGLSCNRLGDALTAAGVKTSGGYCLLHELPYFAEGFDLFGHNRGPLCGDYAGYKWGDFPVTEKMYENLLFLPVVSDPVPGAAKQVLERIRHVVEHADQIGTT
jgi:dTDP-4-amino-4,6-dideoxygalactose transaminase